MHLYVRFEHLEGKNDPAVFVLGKALLKKLLLEPGCGKRMSASDLRFNLTIAGLLLPVRSSIVVAFTDQDLKRTPKPSLSLVHAYRDVRCSLQKNPLACSGYTRHPPLRNC